MQETSDLITSLRATWDQIVGVVPDVATAVLLLLLGWLVARLARRLSVRLFRWMRIDALAERTGVEGFLMQGGVEFTAVTLLGGFIYWVILFLTFVALLNMLAVPAGTALLQRILLFVPNVVVAVIVLIFGSVVSRFVGSVTYTYLNNVGSRGAAVIAAIARYAMLGFVVAMAVEQLALKSEILVSGFQIAFGALCLALALAFGLGGREWAAKILDRFWKP
ncbi:MAG TPA: hypothetical protein VG916_11345 [Gemmatimonadaceae bacterium]|nr:hypothetical protein [Gemmatimonadaceae bacterium]